MFKKPIGGETLKGKSGSYLRGELLAMRNGWNTKLELEYIPAKLSKHPHLVPHLAGTRVWGS